MSPTASIESMDFTKNVKEDILFDSGRLFLTALISCQ
jgi:hypothetical protein